MASLESIRLLYHPFCFFDWQLGMALTGSSAVERPLEGFAEALVAVQVIGIYIIIVDAAILLDALAWHLRLLNHNSLLRPACAKLVNVLKAQIAKLNITVLAEAGCWSFLAFLQATATTFLQAYSEGFCSPGVPCRTIVWQKTAVQEVPACWNACQFTCHCVCRLKQPKHWKDCKQT
jgi:hypothetical protein